MPQAGAAIFALTAVQAVNSIASGYAQNAEAKANASIVEGQARLIDVQADIEFGQYQRAKGKALSTSVAGAAAANIMPQGSAMAVMVDTQTQMSIDQAIGKFNYTMEKNFKLAEADSYRRAGKQAIRSGYTNAFTSILKGAASYATYSGGAGNTTTAGTTLDSTFEPVRMNNASYYNAWNRR